MQKFLCSVIKFSLSSALVVAHFPISAFLSEAQRHDNIYSYCSSSTTQGHEVSKLLSVKLLELVVSTILSMLMHSLP